MNVKPGQAAFLRVVLAIAFLRSAGILLGAFRMPRTPLGAGYGRLGRLGRLAAGNVYARENSALLHFYLSLTRYFQKASLASLASHRRNNLLISNDEMPIKSMGRYGFPGALASLASHKQGNEINILCANAWQHNMLSSRFGEC
jgi:hypothetical protein